MIIVELVGFVLVFLAGILVGSLAQLLAQAKQRDQGTMDLAVRMVRDLDVGEGYLLSIRKEREGVFAKMDPSDGWKNGFELN